MAKTHFGFDTIDEADKAHKVAEVFHSVANKYDLMNDLMSFGLHRLWKIFTIVQANVRPGQRVLDLAGGTGDLASSFAEKVGAAGEVWLTDINSSMLSVGRDRLLNKGIITPLCLCDAQAIPFANNYFDLITVAFGLRNMTHKEEALKEMRRVLKPGGKLLILEFSKIWQPLAKAYDFYSFNVLPWLGNKITQSADSYRYLAESIRMHPDQLTLKNMMLACGLDDIQVFNLSFGVVALHQGTKF